MTHSKILKLSIISALIVCLFAGLCIFASAVDCSHVFSDELYTIVEPTCTSTGARARKCTICGDFDTTNQEIISKAPHSYELKSSKAATCSADGYKKYECSVCHDKKTEVLPALPHTLNNWYVILDPTCTEEGTEEAVCTVCGAHKTRPVAANGHAIRTIEGKAPTCTEDGLSEYQACDICHKVFSAQRIIPATGHSYGDIVYDGAEPTCTETGTAHRFCTVCNAPITVPLEKLPHVDADEDGFCDECGTDMKVQTCGCFCHSGSLASIFTRWFDTILSKITGKELACCDDMEPLEGSLTSAVLSYITNSLTEKTNNLTDKLTLTTEAA